MSDLIEIPATADFLLKITDSRTILAIGGNPTEANFPGRYVKYVNDNDNSLSYQYDLAWCANPERFDESQLMDWLGRAKVAVLSHAEPQSYWLERLLDSHLLLDVRLTQQCRTLAGLEKPNSDLSRHVLVLRRGLPVPKTRDLLLTYAAGEAYCESAEMQVFLNSIARSGMTADRLCFTHEMSLLARERFEAAGFIVLDIRPDWVNWIVRDRFRVFRDFIDHHPHHDRILLADARDIVFFGDPFEYCPWDDDFLLVISEGHRHRDSPWNTRDQRNFLGDSNVNFEDWEVINGGIQIGSRRMIRMLCDQVYELSDPKNRPVDHIPTDQAVLNSLSRKWMIENLPVRILQPGDQPRTLHGEAIKNGFMNADYDCGVLKSGDDHFLIYHQWDRTNHRGAILEDFS